MPKKTILCALNLPSFHTTLYGRSAEVHAFAGESFLGIVKGFDGKIFPVRWNEYGEELDCFGGVVEHSSWKLIDPFAEYKRVFDSLPLLERRILWSIQQAHIVKKISGIKLIREWFHARGEQCGLTMAKYLYEEGITRPDGI